MLYIQTYIVIVIKFSTEIIQQLDPISTTYKALKLIDNGAFNIVSKSSAPIGVWKPFEEIMTNRQTDRRGHREVTLPIMK